MCQFGKRKHFAKLDYSANIKQPIAVMVGEGEDVCPHLKSFTLEDAGGEKKQRRSKRKQKGAL